MKARYIGLISALIVFSSCARASCDDTIRVGLVRFYSRVAGVTLSSCSGVTVTGADGAELASCEAADSITLLSDGGAVTIKSGLDVKTAAGPFVRVSPSDPASTIRVACLARPSRDYRGDIEARPRTGALQLVNVVSVEDYLPGVVPEEMPSSYPAEAVKAQAIAARTFALRNRGKHRSDGYDLCDTTNCQLYGGVQSEKPRSTQAIDATRGLVLTYSGQLASVMYSTDCGGVTDDSGGKFPYLCFVAEPADMPHCSWEVKLTPQELGRKLAAAGVKGADGLSAIRVSEADQSGRAANLELTTCAGRVIVSGVKFRGALASSGVKSQLLTVAMGSDGNVVIKGKGAGHGVGLCQVGAKWLAASPQGNTCRQILSHYYPGTDVTQLNGTSAPSPPPATTAKLAPSPQPSDTPEQTVTRKIEVKRIPPAKPSRPALDVRLEAPEGL